MKKGIILGTILALMTVSIVSAKGFLKASGKNIVDENNENVLLRGIGMGGWMLQEGYMLQFPVVAPKYVSAQHEIKEEITSLIGADATDRFYEAWRNNYCSRADIDSLKKWGFNSVRLPLHYNLFTLPIEEEPIAGEDTWINTGFELTDSLLSWCAANEIYLILDLHAAPGGQGSNKGISDYDETKPSLWESFLNKMKTVNLWKRIARHYANEEWIGGYDLINETNWNLPGGTDLRNLYQEITTAIRSVDTNHILFIEGNWYANDFTGLTPPWDDNMAYSFHKYWSKNNQSDIKWVLDIRDNYNVPLWCGESGENSNQWYADAIKLLEDNHIGWSWWPHKKVESISGLIDIIKPDGYQRLLDYWGGSASRPSAAFAETALMNLAENLKLENCIIHRDVIDAMFRLPFDDQVEPFADLSIPGTIPAAYFDRGKQNGAYYDNDVADYHVSTGTYTAWNKGWEFRNDGVDIQFSQDSNGAPYNISHTEDGEWIKYTVDVAQTDSYQVTLRVASDISGSILTFKLDDSPVSGNVYVQNTHGWHTWENQESGKFYLPKGKHELKLQVVKGGFNINQITFKATGTGLIPDENNPVHNFRLKQNHPNPFNSGTMIPFDLIDPAKVKINIYDNRGRLVKTFGEKNYNNGPQSVYWYGETLNGNAVASGVYFCQAISGSQVQTIKIAYIR